MDYIITMVSLFRTYTSYDYYYYDWEMPGNTTWTSVLWTFGGGFWVGISMWQRY